MITRGVTVDHVHERDTAEGSGDDGGRPLGLGRFAMTGGELGAGASGENSP
jgi:hypothetical protein